MASGENRPYRKGFLDNEDIENKNRERGYIKEERYNAAREFSQMQLSDDETGSETRQHLAEVEAEIAREEDSATIVRSPRTRKDGPSSKERLKLSEKKLEFVRARKVRIHQLFETMKSSQTVDVCFLIDCTGSMDPYIDQVKLKIDALVAHCKTIFDDLNLRVAFVGYRDHYDGDRVCDDEERIISLQFTDNIANFRSFVSIIKVYGGGDAAEDVFGGLEEAGNLEWSSPTRILFHVTDAPCHGRQYHEDVLDDFPNGDPRGLNAGDLLNVLEDKNIAYWFAKITDKTDKMIAEFRKLLRTPTMLQQVKLESAEQLMFAVADSISSSIRDAETTTLAAAGVGGVDAFSHESNPAVQRPALVRSRSLKEFTICEETPVWSSIRSENAIVFRNKLADGTVVDNLRQPLEEEKKNRKIQIATQPFAEGAQRIVYYGIDCTFDTPKKVVFKEFKYLGAGLNKLESYKRQMEIQSISFFLSREFNKQKPVDAKNILFTKVVVVSLRGRPKPFYCSQEPLIEGSYVKYNSNHGFVNKNEYAATLNAFSHWTYHVTDGYLMVVDLQGVKHSTGDGFKFTLTDPALHCKDLTRFSSTNLGTAGMHRFFRTHHCNSICKAMSLPLHRHQPKSSTMSEQGWFGGLRR
ncbi:alpha-protein kinase vwkA-like [Dendronephthya gigantea]|uniref:alpha-protein kinase vwkA-like n=1 Tax=Dendronephthya gigantea TaxID=151771 RepID=UPI00106C7F1A|nr:alpha-protein kinase vwkA-like [Dendronephthya gigantea]